MHGLPLRYRHRRETWPSTCWIERPLSSPHHSLTIDHNCSHGVKGGIDEADSIDLTRPGLTRVGKMSAATFDMNDWPKLGGWKRGVSDRMWVKPPEASCGVM